MIKHLKKKYIITGCLSSLGQSLIKKLAVDGTSIIGIDNLSPASAPFVHHDFILNELKEFSSFEFYAADIRDLKTINTIFCNNSTDYLINTIPLDLKNYSEGILKSDKNIAVLVEMLSLAVINGIKNIVLPFCADLDMQLINESLIYDLEQELNIKNQTIPKENGETVCRLFGLPLPSLIGVGQSFFSFPLTQIRQLLADIETKKSDLQIDLIAMKPDSASEIICTIIDEENFDCQRIVDLVTNKSFIYDQNQLWNALYRYFVKQMNLEKSEERSNKADQDIVFDNFNEDKIAELANEIISYYNHLTYNIPPDWAERNISKRKEKNAKKRRKK